MKLKNNQKSHRGIQLGAAFSTSHSVNSFIGRIGRSWYICCGILSAFGRALLPALNCSGWFVLFLPEDWAAILNSHEHGPLITTSFYSLFTRFHWDNLESVGGRCEIYLTSSGFAAKTCKHIYKLVNFYEFATYPRQRANPNRRYLQLNGRMWLLILFNSWGISGIFREKVICETLCV